MSGNQYTEEDLIDALRGIAARIGKAPSRSEFQRHSGIGEYWINKYFKGYNDFVTKAGLAPHTSNQPVDPDVLLRDWGELVQRLRHIPTRATYRREGKYAPGTFEKYFGPWSTIPEHFKAKFGEDPQWTDVCVLLPPPPKALRAATSPFPSALAEESGGDLGSPVSNNIVYSKLDGRPTYGSPIDFRGLRHEPVNEQGVVLLFGMVARELGFLVEAVQTGFPDCEAKRQIGKGKWQRVRIEFEFESRNFRDHGHPPEGCDVIVCWRHNWSECPEYLEVIELREVLKGLPQGDDT